MKIGMIADIHLKVTDSMSKIDPVSGLSIRTLDKLEALKTALQMSIHDKCEYFFILGDIYDKLNPPETLKKAFLNTILPFIDRIDVVIIVGNHDGARFTHNYLSEQELLKFFNLENKLKIVSDSHEVIVADEHHFVLQPWDPNVENIMEVLEQYREVDNVIFLGHLEVKGAVASTEYVLTKGIVPAAFKPFKRAFLGHYHKRQFIGNISYIGSPVIQDFSEIEFEKGFSIYDTDEDEEYFIKLEKRQVYQFELNPDNLDEIQDYIDKNPIEEGSLVKLVFKGTADWIAEISGLAYQVFTDFKPLKIKRDKIIEKILDNNTREIIVKKSRIDRIREIAKEQNEEIINIGIELYRSAENEYMESI